MQNVITNELVVYFAERYTKCCYLCNIWCICPFFKKCCVQEKTAWLVESCVNMRPLMYIQLMQEASGSITGICSYATTAQIVPNYAERRILLHYSIEICAHPALKGLLGHLKM